MVESSVMKQLTQFEFKHILKITQIQTLEYNKLAFYPVTCLPPPILANAYMMCVQRLGSKSSGKNFMGPGRYCAQFV